MEASWVQLDTVAKTLRQRSLLLVLMPCTAAACPDALGRRMW